MVWDVSGAMMPRLLILVVVLVVVEVAILAPVIVVQHNNDIAVQTFKLNAIMDAFVGAVNNTINQFIYGVLRTSGATTIVPGFLTQQQLEDSLVVSRNPSSTPDLLYLWVPLVADTNRTSFEDFYGYPITQLNGTMLKNATTRTLYAPICLIVPFLPNATSVLGFDLLSVPLTSVLLQNRSLYMFPHATLLQSNPNSFGLLILSLDADSKGYVIGRVGAEDLLAFSLQIPRTEVTLCAFDESAPSTLQLLFCDNVPFLENIGTVAAFNTIAERSQFYMRGVNILGERLLIYVKFADAYASIFMPATWIILVSVLVPACCCVDLIAVGLVLLWWNRGKIQRLEKEKREAAQIMLGYVNHEIRNPLQTILGLSEWCLEELGGSEANARVVSNLATIVRSAEFIQHIANDILDVRRIEEGKIVLQKVVVDIGALFSGLEKSVQALMAEKPDVVFRIAKSDCQIELQTDRYRVEQILMNFLTNAFKNTERGTIILAARMEHELSSVRISVADTGRGIPDEKKGQLFAQFRQVDMQDATKFGGFGLGLFLCKMLAGVLGGNIGFESRLGEGSVFWLDLPVVSLDFQFEETATPVKK